MERRMAQREEPIWRVADMGLVIGCERVTTKANVGAWARQVLGGEGAAAWDCRYVLKLVVCSMYVHE